LPVYFIHQLKWTIKSFLGNIEIHPCKEDFIEFGEKIGLAENRVIKLIEPFLKKQVEVENLVKKSFLDKATKEQYLFHHYERLGMLNYE
jgi:hypothetical protein